ncbi:MAG TPA: alpha/beta hydrolase [Streptosporangiaceae bacterium]|jgi:pimeloyl-ACP methyl ester carboxylesterase
MHRSPAEGLTSPATGAPSPPAPPIPPWPGEFVTTRTGQVYVRTAPAEPGAEPALCVHGLGGSSTNWTDLMDLLREPPHPLACEALDLPGHGHSPPARDDDYTIRALATVVAALIERRDRGPVHLIANSLGGAVCTKLAADRPDLVRTMTLVSPALPDLRPRSIPARISALKVPGFGSWLITRAGRIPPPQRVAMTLRDVYFNPSRVHPQRVAEEVAEVDRMDVLGYGGDVLLKSAKGLISEYLRRGPQTLWRDAARVAASVLVIHGSNDRLVDPRMAARAARTFPHVRTVILSRTGHVAMMERPAEVVDEMRILLGQEARAC